MSVLLLALVALASHIFLFDVTVLSELFEVHVGSTAFDFLRRLSLVCVAGLFTGRSPLSVA